MATGNRPTLEDAGPGRRLSMLFDWARTTTKDYRTRMWPAGPSTRPPIRTPGSGDAPAGAATSSPPDGIASQRRHHSHRSGLNLIAPDAALDGGGGNSSANRL